MELKAAAGRYFRRSFSAAAGHVESVAQVRAPSGLRKQHPPATGADVATQTVAASGSGPDCRSAVSQVKAPARRILTAANRVPSRSDEASDRSAPPHCDVTRTPAMAAVQPFLAEPTEPRASPWNGTVSATFGHVQAHSRGPTAKSHLVQTDPMRVSRWPSRVGGRSVGHRSPAIARQRSG